MNVLSLFNGMSFGAMALETLNIEVGKYYSSEIDKYANQATQALFPDVIQLGDVTKWREWDIDWASIDLLIGGSPCQGFSLIGKQAGTQATLDGVDHLVTSRETYLYLKSKCAEFKSQSHLFWEFILCLDHVKIINPKVEFMLENVKMKPAIQGMITEAIGVAPVLMDSLLVVPQSRARFYWSSKLIAQPVKVDWNVSSIIEKSDLDLKPATVRKGDPRPINLTGDHFLCLTATYYKGIRADGRPALSTSAGIFDEMREKGLCRALTPRECARLQTVPEHHIDTLLNAGISKTQLYKMLGNGWTHDVIVHIFKGLL